jgi:hypothetical protein
MKYKRPTLEDRLKHPIKSRGEALLQLKNSGMVLTELAQKELDKYLKVKHPSPTMS